MGDRKTTRPVTLSGSVFPATRWSIIVSAASGPGETAGRRALGDLARAYWFPLYAFIRRRGESPSSAEDLTQEFFARLVEKHWLGGVDRAKGSFRSFLLASVKHFLSNERARERAAKRGGGRPAISLDAMDAEARYAVEPVDDLTPERLFDRRWAMAVLEQVLECLAREYAESGKAELFKALEGCLAGGPGDCGYAGVAGRLAMTEDAVKVAAHRLRRRYRTLLRDEIARTVDSPDGVDGEIAYLLKCL